MNQLPTNRDLLDLKSEKVKDVFPDSKKPYLNCKIRMDTSSAERHLLYLMPSVCGNGLYIDIGSLKGGSSCILGHGIKDNNVNGEIYTIDLFELDPILNKKKCRKIRENINNYFKDNLNVPINVIKHDSSSYANILNKEISFAFIDGDHSYAGCKKDWNEWSKYVKINGCVAFHDCHILDVDKVINEIDYTQWEQIFHVFSIKVFRRRQ